MEIIIKTAIAATASLIAYEVAITISSLAFVLAFKKAQAYNAAIVIQNKLLLDEIVVKTASIKVTLAMVQADIVQLATREANALAMANQARIAGVLSQIQSRLIKLRVQEQVLLGTSIAATNALATAEARLAVSTTAAAKAHGLLATALGASTKAMIRFLVVIVANPLVTLSIVVGAAIAALLIFGDKIKLVRRETATLQGFFVAAWQLISEGMIEARKDLVIFIEEFKSQFPGIGKLLKDVADSFELLKLLEVKDILLGIASVIDAWISLGKIITSIFSGISKNIKDVFFDLLIQANNKIIDFANSIVQGVGSLANKFPKIAEFFGLEELKNLDTAKIFAPIDNHLEGAAKRFGEDIEASIADALGGTPAQDLVRLTLSRANENAKVREREGFERASKDEAQKILEFGASFIADLEEEIFLLGFITREREAEKNLLEFKKKAQTASINLETETGRILLASITTLEKEKILLTDQGKILDEILGPLIEHESRTNAINEAEKIGRITKEQYNQAIRDENLSYRELVDPVGLYIEQLNEELDILKLGFREREFRLAQLEEERRLNRKLTQEEILSLRTVLTSIRIQDQLNETIERLTSSRREAREGFEILNLLFTKGERATKAYRKSLNELQLQFLTTANTAKGGLQRALATLELQYNDLSSVASETMVGAFQSAEDAMIDFLVTGERNFKEFITSIIRDLLRLALQKAILAPLASTLSGILGFNFASSIGAVSNTLGDTSNLDSLSNQLNELANSVNEPLEAFTLQPLTKDVLINFIEPSTSILDDIVKPIEASIEAIIRTSSARKNINLNDVFTDKNLTMRRETLKSNELSPDVFDNLLQAVLNQSKGSSVEPFSPNQNIAITQEPLVASGGDTFIMNQTNHFETSGQQDEVGLPPEFNDFAKQLEQATRMVVVDEVKKQKGVGGILNPQRKFN